MAWWLQRKKGLPVNRKRVLRVMRERGLLVRSRRLRARRKKEWGRVEVPFQTLGGHIRNAQSKYEETSRALERFGGRLDGIARQGDTEISEGEAAVALLPPPA